MTAERSVKTAIPDYAGDVSPAEAMERLNAHTNAVLVDVRSPQEWHAVGIPDISATGRKLITLSWKLPPEWALNPMFVEQFKAHDVPVHAPVFFICKSGGRSLDAAVEMTHHGWTHCYNVLGGFEGHGNANTPETQGWKNAGLPWGSAV